MRTKITFLVLVDSSKEMDSALKFACLRSNAVDGHVALLHVVKLSQVVDPWFSIVDIARQEARADAERLLKTYGKKARSFTGRVASVFLREGDVVKEFLKLIEEERSISMAVLAASDRRNDPGPVLSCLLERGFAHVRMPIIIVPGGMSDKDLKSLC